MRTFAGIVAIPVSIFLMYRAMYEHIEATAHSNPGQVLTWIQALAALLLLSFANFAFWRKLRWFSLLVVLGIEGIGTVILVVLFWLPFP